MRLSSLLVLVLLTSCATGRMPQPARVAAQGSRLVDRIWYNPHPSTWRSSGWYRAFTDLTTPMRVVISNDGAACIMGNLEVDEPLRASHYVCVTGWRNQSGSTLRP